MATRVKSTSWFDPRLMGVLGVFAAGVLLSEVNVLASRYFKRYDFSHQKRYSLTPTSKKLISTLTKPVSITVLLGSGDPTLEEARNLLTSYVAETSLLEVRYVDPDRNAAEYLALSQKLKIGEEALRIDGIASAAFLVESEKRTWIVRASKLSRVDAEGVAHSRLEAELTEGIARVNQQGQTQVCFTAGHGERSIDDAAPEGLARFARRLTQSNILSSRVPLDVPDLMGALEGCEAVAVVGPDRPFSRSHERLLQDATQSGAGLLLFLDPIIDREGKVVNSGLDKLAASVGAALDPGFILESDPAHRLPQGLGEIFFASSTTHPITDGLSTDVQRLDSRVLFVAAQGVRQVPGAPVSPLLTTSTQASLVDDLNNLREAPTEDGKHYLALALDRGHRSVVVGSSNLLWNQSFQDPSLLGNQVFSENAFAWVLDRPALVSIPDRPQMSAGLNLSEQSLSDLLRYVIVYIPLAAACIGGVVLLRRRKKEEISRRTEEVTR